MAEPERRVQRLRRFAQHPTQRLVARRWRHTPGQRSGAAVAAVQPGAEGPFERLYVYTVVRASPLPERPPACPGFSRHSNDCQASNQLHCVNSIAAARRMLDATTPRRADRSHPRVQPLLHAPHRRAARRPAGHAVHAHRIAPALGAGAPRRADRDRARARPRARPRLPEPPAARLQGARPDQGHALARTTPATCT